MEVLEIPLFIRTNLNILKPKVFISRNIISFNIVFMSFLEFIFKLNMTDK